MGELGRLMRAPVVIVAGMFALPVGDLEDFGAEALPGG
jgi:hypothetical protein